MQTAEIPAAEREPERFFFVHLQKTGGVALYQRLLNHFGPSGIYPHPDELGDVNAVMDVGLVTERFAERAGETRVITGHFPLCLVDVLDVPFTTFTVLRDPVERTLSLLRRRQQKGNERFQGRSLEEVYATPGLDDIIRNHMVKMLSFTREELTPSPLITPVVFDEGRLARAKSNLEHRIDAFGFQEDFDDFCTELRARFGWDLGDPVVSNSTQHQPVSEELRERIAADNRMDVELYDFARQLARDRAA